MATYDTIVIGGGVVGASAAYHLAREGRKTLLIDSRDPGRATDAGAGIIAPETSGTSISRKWMPLAIRAGMHYPTLIQQLADEGAGDTGYQVCGELILAADEDELPAYQEKLRVVVQRQRERGQPSREDLHEITSDEARELFPALKPVLKALYFRGAARVDGRLLAGAMLTAAQNRGLDVQNERAGELVIENGRVIGVRVQGSAIQAGNVIIAGGAWSAAFSEQLGCTIAVEPQRGQIIHLHTNGMDTGNWPIAGGFHNHYLVGWPDGRVVAGATRETGSGFTVQTTAGGVQEVLYEALRIAPGLGGARLGDIRVGLRPRTTDNLPVLGEVPSVESIYLATGHGANGLLLGPYSGKLAADWTMGQAAKFDMTAFHVSRFESEAHV